jgi:hypothetical protein
LSSPDSQERLKEEAKNIRTRIETLIKDTDAKTRMMRTLCIYAGMITETLLEYEEPDVVMEQAFHRISELVRAEPADGAADELMPLAYTLDHDTELGRVLARNTAKKLPKGLDDMHEIAIALIISDFPSWEKDGYARDRMLRLLVESVIASLTFEMATQDFCDLLVEEFMSDNSHTTAEALTGLGAVAGNYFNIAQAQMKLPCGAENEFMNVMVRESLRHGTPGTKDWASLAAANDSDDRNIPEYLKEIKPAIEEFFVLIGLDDPLGRAVAVAKAVGRMVAVISVEDVGQIHPNIAKSLAKTGMILGTLYKEQIISA